VDPLAPEETRTAVGVLAELDWLAGEIAAEQTDDRALARQVNIAPVLFAGMDDVDAAPVLRRFLASNGIDLDAVLGWLQPGAPVIPWPQRLPVVERARARLRPWVTAAVGRLPAPEQAELAAAALARRDSLSVEAGRRRPRRSGYGT
jgi:hypothetical protein